MPKVAPLLLLVASTLLLPSVAVAQAPEVSVAVTREIVLDASGSTAGDNIEAGTIIVYDEAEDIYRFARDGDETGELGVVVDNALLLFRTSDGVPVAHSGAVPVRVSTLGGNISVGDLITPSQIHGVGTRASQGTVNGLGTALDSFTMATSSTEDDIEGEFSIAYGTITVSLAASKLGAFERSDIKEEANKNDEGTRKELVGIALFAVLMAKVIIAGLITAASLFFAYRMHEKHVVAGITSIGRNPLAKATIQSTVLINMALIAVIIAAAVALSIMIVVFPV